MGRSKMTLTTLMSAVVASLILGGFALAHSGATGVVKERMNMMKDMGKAMKEMAAMFRGRTAYDPARVRTLATDMQARAEHIAKMFPKGSNKPPSEAKDTIWTDAEGFAKSASELGEYAATLAAKADDQEAAKPAFRNLGGTCKSCHTDYRIKKE